MHHHQSGRYERKYVLSEATALDIRRFVAAYLPHDPHMSAADQDGYPVYSLYLDSPQLDLYRRSVDDEKNRFKLRIRFYDDCEASPAFLEIKRRIGDTIHKQRAEVSKLAASKLLQGKPVDSGELHTSNERALRALTEFADYRARLAADGMVLVAYRREAYAAPAADGTRVTFDRHVAGQPYKPHFGLMPPSELTLLTPACVVLELKHFGQAPGWISDMVATFGLRRTSFAKYVRCMNATCLSHANGTLPHPALALNGASRRELA